MKLHLNGIAAACTIALSIGAICTPAQEQSRAVVNGTIVDTLGGVIADAKVSLSGYGREYHTSTMSDGKYTINVRPGIYELRVARPGFCDGRRNAFVLKPGVEVTFDFALFVCGSMDPIQVRPDDGNQSPSHPLPDRYQHEDLSPIAPGELRPLVLFGDRKDADGTALYSSLILLDKHFPVVYAYNLLTIRANTLTYSRRDNSVHGAGDVTWQDGRSTRRGSKIDVAFLNGEPHVTLTD